MDFLGKITANVRIAQDTYCLSVGGVPVGVFAAFVPGRFAHLRVPNAPDLLLRRPLAIFDARPERRELDFVYRVVGEGTRRLIQAKPGVGMQILAPLGNGFTLPDGAKTGAVIGGGTGCAALLSVPKGFPGVQWSAFLGFPGERDVFAAERFAAAFARAEIFTDDGSCGAKGNPVSRVAELACTDALPDVLFACGPDPMLRALKAVLPRTAACRVSLEARMGCGVGACLVCACAVAGGEEKSTSRGSVASGSGHYRRVCADGPIFDLWEVELDG